jgi:RNA polymerase sigma-70 factor (ECF subfamily)
MFEYHAPCVPMKASEAVRPWRRTTDPDDAALLSAVARRDHDACATLYRRYGAILLGLLHRILGSRPEAEDVLHEVFLQVWRTAADFDEVRGSAFVWLTVLARSRALDRRDALATRSRTLVRAAGTVVETAPDAAEIASSGEQRRRLLGALAEIPEPQRDVLLLAYFEGLSQTEIAARLDKPLGTIKSLARLGLDKLRARLRSVPTRRWSRR